MLKLNEVNRLGTEKISFVVVGGEYTEDGKGFQ